MKLVIQRVSRAEVRVGREVVGRIGTGLLVLVGIEVGDTAAGVQRGARKVASLRVFEDSNGKMNLGLEDVGGDVLAVSQFTLAGSIRRGRRPAFDRAMGGADAEVLFETFVAAVGRQGIHVETGRFGAMMAVELVNDGPVTLIWDDPAAGDD